MIERRSRIRRFFEIELPAILLVILALAPYVWMAITSIKPTVETITSGLAQTCN